MPGQCAFREDWIKDSEFSDWLTKHANKRMAYCKLCRKEFSISSSGVCQLRSHAKGLKHAEALKTWKAQTTKTLKLDDFCVKSTAQSAGTSDQHVAAAQPATGGACALKNDSCFINRSTAEQILKAEILCCLNMVDKHLSHKSQSSNNALFKAMFPDSTIAKNFSCNETKTRYMTTHG